MESACAASCSRRLWSLRTASREAASPSSPPTNGESSAAAMASCSSSTRSSSRSWYGTPSPATSAVLPFPQGSSPGMMVIDGAVLRATGDVHGGTDTQSSTFQVVLLCSELEFSRAFACVYSSENGVWSDPLSISYPPMFVTNIPSALVGSSLYWYLIGDSAAILEFDLDRQRLALIDMPYGYEMPFNFCLIPADGGVLGFLCVSNHDVYLWKRTTDGGGAAVWVLDRTIELNNLLPLSSHEALKIHGFAEDGKVLLIGTTDCIFTIQLESMKFARFSIHLASLNSSICHPFSSVYTSGMGLGDEQENELLLDTMFKKALGAL